MENKTHLSFLITHYNRFENLQDCVAAIKKLDLDFEYEIVVSDDGSTEDIQEKLKTIEVNHVVLSDYNKGLAHNINKGIRTCKGNYILYCQDDFILTSDINKIIKESIFVLASKKVDLVRFRANYFFKELTEISENIKLIPKFSFKNFLLNAFQYSDNVFIVRSNFFSEFGFYLENTSGDYGETEYAIRIFKSKARIGIVSNGYVVDVEGGKSVMRENSKQLVKGKKKFYLRKFIRAIRLHLEYLFYNKNRRGLLSYKNRFSKRRLF
ncbi:Glycosyltransferase, GT2 family [Flavobacterium glycines]|nr:glycosyltransferase family 2 protein [Flavobacterium glycines]GEL12409.1 hypothetical protein FGL01_31480 [Flavobacterium glycines]SDJ52449.1 Glycosyltransferase, GT2 family [Flavobacterium glycines]